MKDYLFCHIGDCSFKIGVELTANLDDCEKAIEDYKKHLKTHTLDEVVDALFNSIMMLRGDSLCWKKESLKC